LKIFKNEFPDSSAGTLGLFLSVPPAKLKDFKRENKGDVEGEMKAVLNYWLDTDGNKSWTKLADAVELCDHKLLADKIRRKI